MMDTDELVHVIKQIVSQASIEQRSSVYAHVSDYDPNTHTMRVIVPSMRDDQTGAPLHSGWLPFGSPLVGAQSGIQVVPQGGASSDNPTMGELALVHLNERGTGVAAVSALFYTGEQRPPNTALATGQSLQPGEILIHQASGTIMRFHTNGDVEITTAGNGAVSVTTSGSGTMALTASGSGGMTLNASGSGAMVLESANPVQVKADLHVTGAVIAGFGTTDQVGLQTHHGHAANSNIPPTPGT